jgi:hypothetical protein
MSNPIAKVLDEVGLYTPLKHLQRYVTDSQYRKNRNELDEDLVQTRREVASWAAQRGGDVASGGLFGVLSFTNLPMHAKFHCLVAKAMQLRGYEPIIFTQAGARHAHEYFRLFGIRHLVMWNEWVLAEGPSTSEVATLMDSLLSGDLSVSQAMEINFHGVDVGKHALSMTCRKRVEGRLNLADGATLELFREQFRRSLQSVLTAERFLDRYPVKKLLVRDSGYTPNGAIYEVALNRGVDCVVLEFGQRRSTWIFKRYTPQTKMQHYFSLSAPTWQRLKDKPWTPAEDAALNQEFSGRYRPDSTDDTRRLQTGKKLKTPAEVRTQLGLDPAKKTAVIFSHVAWDATFFYGTCLFNDFEDWLFQTVQFVAQHCPHINWVVKVHPFNVFKLQFETVTETSEMRLLAPLMLLPDHVRILHADTDINTQSLFPTVDYVLTVNGTVGMEFPCFGIPALVAGTGRYNGLGFTIEPPTREAYFEALRTLHTVPRLTTEAIHLARRHFYYLIRGKQVSFEDIAPMELKRLHEAQSDVSDNLHITARSVEDFAGKASIRLLAEWLASSTEPDLLELEIP